MPFELEGPATKVAELIWQNGPKVLPAEVLDLDPDTAAIVVDIDGVDYIMTMTRVPRQRPRPTSN